jgi:hypothetical protein
MLLLKRLQQGRRRRQRKECVAAHEAGSANPWCAQTLRGSAQHPGHSRLRSTVQLLDTGGGYELAGIARAHPATRQHADATGCLAHKLRDGSLPLQAQGREAVLGTLW